MCAFCADVQQDEMRIKIQCSKIKNKGAKVHKLARVIESIN